MEGTIFMILFGLLLLAAIVVPQLQAYRDKRKKS